MAHKFPRSSKLLSESMYVDDLLTGAENEEAALNLYEDANDMMTEASMKLHKWASNSKLLRERFETDTGDTKHLGYVAGVLKVLGLVWNPVEDKLGYTVDNVPSYDEENLHTKRTMLKATASVYDPLGWVAPFLVRAKHLFQKLWVMEVDWDDVVPDGIDTEWKKWCSEVDKLRNIQVPRRYTESLPSQSCFFTLHIFADASPIAYGTVAYLSGTDEHDNTTSTILISKSRIAPVKTLTLARLELMACVLSARLYSYLQRHLKVRLEEVVFWSDSTITIHWINGEPSRWKTFVRNRVEDIQRHTDATQWRHCSGKENPADLVTRGVSATNLVYSTLWWNGPEWIRESKENWPQGKTDGVQYHSSEEEAVKETGVLQTQVAETTGNALLDVESYSSLH
ncbi:uncharacterized protein LOC135384463 [Ornithodoros turicata]|uniref:uncharacterized protein LOC135384463 n=1 Tax=Ornithodoros turicata TaxID=34597 RepID=UPI0031399F35